MSTLHPSLPEYAHPPLVAATLGVLCKFLLELDKSFLTEYQQRLGPEWIGEWSRTSSPNADPRTDIGVISAPGYQLKNVLGDRLVQVTRGHFSFTWLGTSDGRY